MTRAALAIAACLALSGCAFHGKPPTVPAWTGSPARWYAIGERLDCPAPMHLIKAYHGWRDPVLDVPPDGSPAPWGNLTFASVSFADIEGPLGTAPPGVIRWHEWCLAPRQATVRAVWEREYEREYPTTTPLLMWRIVRCPTGPPYARLTVHAIEPGKRALLSIATWK